MHRQLSPLLQLVETHQRAHSKTKRLKPLHASLNNGLSVCLEALEVYFRPDLKRARCLKCQKPFESLAAMIRDTDIGWCDSCVDRDKPSTAAAASRAHCNPAQISRQRAACAPSRTPAPNASPSRRQSASAVRNGPPARIPGLGRRHPQALALVLCPSLRQQQSKVRRTMTWTAAVTMKWRRRQRRRQRQERRRRRQVTAAPVLPGTARRGAESDHGKDAKDRNPPPAVATTTNAQRSPQPLSLSVQSSPELTSLPALSPGSPSLPHLLLLSMADSALSPDAANSGADSLLQLHVPAAASHPSSEPESALVPASPRHGDTDFAAPETEAAAASASSSPQPSKKQKRKKQSVNGATKGKGKAKGSRRKKAPKELKAYQTDKKAIVLATIRQDAQEIALRLPPFVADGVQHEFQERKDDAKTLSATLSFIPGQQSDPFRGATEASKLYVQQSAFGRKIDLRARFACGRCARPFLSYPVVPHERRARRLGARQPAEAWISRSFAAKFSVSIRWWCAPKSTSRCCAISALRCWRLFKPRKVPSSSGGRCSSRIPSIPTTFGNNS